jgi:purine nucleosidase
MKVNVECESKSCAGMIIADLRRNPLIGTPVNVCIDVDADIAINKILSVFV